MYCVPGCVERWCKMIKHSYLFPFTGEYTTLKYGQRRTKSSFLVEDDHRNEYDVRARVSHYIIIE
jgi:hypothetical protein